MYESINYFNKLVDQYNNTYHYSINKKAVNTDYFDWKKLGRIIKLLNLIIKLLKCTMKIGQEKYLLWLCVRN